MSQPNNSDWKSQCLGSVPSGSSAQLAGESTLGHTHHLHAAFANCLLWLTKKLKNNFKRPFKKYKVGISILFSSEKQTKKPSEGNKKITKCHHHQNQPSARQEAQNPECCPHCVKGALKLSITEYFRRAMLGTSKTLPSYCLVFNSDPKGNLGMCVKTYILNINILI